MVIRGFLCTALAVTSTAFQIHSTFRTRSPLLATISVDESVARDIETLSSWASACGVSKENGFDLTENGDGDWSAKTSTGAKKSDRVLYVPSNMILNSRLVREDTEGAQAIMQLLVSKGATHLIPQFFLFIKVLQEYEQGEESPWYPWMESLPRQFSTAISLDGFELSCLPPFLGSLAKIDGFNFAIFLEALGTFDIVSQETKENLDVLKWAFNVVFTRCWGRADGEVDIVPMADMFNHGYPEDVVVDYDQDGNCNVIAVQDVDAGASLRLSYGMPTNPSRYMSTFGFLDESSPATFCKIMAARPSQELLNMGYDFSRLVFYTEDGAIAEEVWDVMLYSLLEGNPEIRNALHEAHTKGDRDTKVAIHGQFFLETCNALLSHVDGTLVELDGFSRAMEEEGMAGHARLPLIRDHNEFVRQTFLKVKARLDQMVSDETGRRGATD